MQSNAMQTQEKAGLPVDVQSFESGWGAETADPGDILIPKILLMQGLSEAVADEKAQMGDMIDSLTFEQLGTGRGDTPSPIKLIPLVSFKQWIIYEKLGGDKIQFKEIVDFTPANANMEKETEDEKRVLCLNFYVMLADQVEDPTAIPYLLSFRITSFRTGQKLSTHFSKCARAKVPPAASIFSLSAKKRQNDHGTFYVYELEPSGKTSEEGLKLAYEWYKTIRAGQTRVDDSDLKAPSEDAPASEPVNAQESKF